MTPDCSEVPVGGVMGLSRQQISDQCNQVIVTITRQTLGCRNARSPNFLAMPPLRFEIIATPRCLEIMCIWRP